MRACHVAIHDRADERAHGAALTSHSAAARCCSRLRERALRSLLTTRILAIKPVLVEGGEPCAMI